MSKKDESGVWPQAETPPDAPAFRAVEDHAAALGVSAPVFAAVKEARRWAAGKKIEKAEFEEAVKAFLKAPMGGR